MTHQDNLFYVYNIIDISISEIKPNYGYVEKYNLSEKIIKINDYLLPDDELIIQLMKMILTNGEEP